jgi:hypothetical protein
MAERSRGDGRRHVSVVYSRRPLGGWGVVADTRFMNALVGSLLGALALIGFGRPRWWLSLGPVVAAIGLAGYRLATARLSRGAISEDVIALAGIVLLAATMEVSLLAGALIRAAVERARGNRASAQVAARAARGIAMVGLAFVGVTLVVARTPRGVFALLGVAAFGVVLARVWRARLRGGRVRTLRARPATRQLASPADRRRARIRRGAARPAPRRRVGSSG